MIRLCLSDSLLLNVSRESTTKDLWDKLGSLYQINSLVNKLFLQKKLYSLRMKDGNSMVEHLKAFNTMVIYVSFVDIKMFENAVRVLAAANPFLVFFHLSLQHCKQMQLQ